MPRKKLSMRIIRETLRLRHEVKLTLRQIAASTGRSYGVAAKYMDAAQATGTGWPLPEDLDEDELIRRGLTNAQTVTAILLGRPSSMRPSRSTA